MKKYFSVGEFADLFHISKQTLFYYERKQIFCPRVVNEKGYRFYAYDQFFTFEVITSLRTIGIPLKEIAAYLKNKSPENLSALFEKKIADYDRQLDIISENKAHLQQRLALIQMASHLERDRITLEEKPARWAVTTPFPEDASSHPHSLSRLALHNKKLRQRPVINEYLTGYILSREAYLQGAYHKISSFYTCISRPEAYPNAKQIPGGLYATLYKKDGYHTKYKEGFETLNTFLDEKHLTVTGDIYVTPIRNFWSTDDPETYITCISIPVTPRQL